MGSTDEKILEIIYETIFTKFQSKTESIDPLLPQIFNSVCNGSFGSQIAMLCLAKNFNGCIDQLIKHLSIWPYNLDEVPSLSCIAINTLCHRNVHKNIKFLLPYELYEKIIVGPQVFTLFNILIY